MNAEDKKDVTMKITREEKEHVIVDQEGMRISAAIAQQTDLPLLMDFLQRPEIDNLFTPALSDPVRKISIPERVEKKFKSGHWIAATTIDHQKRRVVGCLAIVPSRLEYEVPSLDSEHGRYISEGISLVRWGIKEVREISTIVTDPILRKQAGIKGIGAGLLREATRLVAQEGNGQWGFITDSWVGGDMSGFLRHMVNRAYLERQAVQRDPINSGLFDTLVRIYSDPEKRGKDGPPTVLYGIPYSDRDWNFFSSVQSDIATLRKLYRELEMQLK